jgi:UDP-N-acetylglucosamine:LPS N-acetylglucosamine transferase
MHLKQINKLRVLIITSKNGGGHVAATKAVQAALSSEIYEVHTCDPCESIPCDDWYNEYMKKGDFLSASILVRMQIIAEYIAPFLSAKTVIENAITRINPQLIISVIPVNNHVTLALAQKKNIPLFVIPTDLTFSHFLYLINKPPKNFKVLVPYPDLPDVQKLVQKQGFTSDNFIVTGYPLRPEFSATHVHMEMWESIRAELGVSASDKVITVMMGAQGSMKHTLSYVRRILSETGRASAEHRVHLVVMCGENQTLRRILNNIATATRVKIHPLGRKDGNYVATLLQHTDVFYTKPGGSSVNEALCSNVYTIFEDSSAKYIWWEFDNMMYAVNNGCGEVVNNLEFGKQLKKALRRTKRPNHVSCPGREFNANLLRLVESL